MNIHLTDQLTNLKMNRSIEIIYWTTLIYIILCYHPAIYKPRTHICLDILYWVIIICVICSHPWRCVPRTNNVCKTTVFR